MAALQIDLALRQTRQDKACDSDRTWCRHNLVLFNRRLRPLQAHHVAPVGAPGWGTLIPANAATRRQCRRTLERFGRHQKCIAPCSPAIAVIEVDELEVDVDDPPCQHHITLDR
jgi:hypothetical protein